MLPEDKLLGWLCILRLNLSNAHDFHIPSSVRLALLDRGWITFEAEPPGHLHFTPKGSAASDLAAPDWGIDPF